MKYGLDIPTNGAYADPRVLADLATEAEQAGWDGFFLQDVLFSKTSLIDPWIALTAVAMRTQRIKIGVFLTPLPRRRPWLGARETVTLDHFTHRLDDRPSQLTQSQHTRKKGQWQEHGEQNVAGWPSSRNLASSVLH